MIQEMQTSDYEKILLEHTEMCYSVALALTRDPLEARLLTHEVLTWAWKSHNNADDKKGIKMKLLTALREQFLQKHLRPAFNLRKKAALAETG